jgi:hypothetical protein
MTQIYLTTTGTSSLVTINDLGAIQFLDPLVDRPLLQPEGEFNLDDLRNSADLIAAVTAGTITLKDSSGNLIGNLLELAAAASLGPATETSFGSSEIATLAETNAGTDDFRYITPLKLATSAIGQNSHVPVTVTDSSLIITDQSLAVQLDPAADNSLTITPGGLYAPGANLSLGTLTTTTVPINIDTGTDIVLSEATPSFAGLMSAANRVKLDGIEENATADQSAVEVPYSNTTSGLSATNVQTAIDEIISSYDQPLGPATLDPSGRIRTAQLPLIALSEVFVVPDISARNALTVQEGDMVKVIDATGDPEVQAGQPATYVYDGLIWIRIVADSGAVFSVNGQTGVVVLEAEDIGISGYTATNVQDVIDELDSRIFREKTYTAGRSANLGATASQDLRRDDGVATNLAPYAMEFNGKFTQIVLSSTNTVVFTVDVLKNDVSIGSYSRTNGQTTQVIDIADPQPTAAKGDRIRIRYLNAASTIQNPSVQLTYLET